MPGHAECNCSTNRTVSVSLFHNGASQEARTWNLQSSDESTNFPGLLSKKLRNIVEHKLQNYSKHQFVTEWKKEHFFNVSPAFKVYLDTVGHTGAFATEIHTVLHNNGTHSFGNRL
jgi:hypothetical protein